MTPAGFLGGKYETPGSPETEYQPGSRGRVLVNTPGIQSRQAIDRLEFDALVSSQKNYLENRISADTRFTEALIKEMHLDWLGTIYSWAGKYRTVDLAKNDFRWPHWRYVPDSMTALENGPLRELTPCIPGTIVEVATRLAVVHAELIMVHPFRDGNGRLARWLSDLMTLQAGLPYPSYGLTGRGSKTFREGYYSALRSGFLKDYLPLTGFFVRALEQGLALAEG